MITELFQAGSRHSNSRYGLWIVLLFLCVALLVDGWRRRANPTWMLNPSNILIMLGVGPYIYKGLHDPSWDLRYSASIGTMIIALAFVIRQWEDEAVREIDESDLDKEEGRDSPRKG
jgi:hypothetical protein